MGAMAAYSQPILGQLQSYGGGGTDDDGSSSSGELTRALARPPAPPPPRRRSYGDVLPLDAAAVPCAAKPRRLRSERAGERASLLAPPPSPPRYVSFEDVIGAAGTPFGDSGGPPPEPGAGISDPLVRAASRLYARGEAAALVPRQRSPGPLGTRRGSAMHGIVKKYVHPFLGLVAGVFCCAIPS